MQGEICCQKRQQLYCTCCCAFGYLSNSSYMLNKKYRKHKPKNVLQTLTCKVMNVDGIVKTVRGDTKHGITPTFAHFQKHVCLAKVREKHLRLCVGFPPKVRRWKYVYIVIFFLSFFLLWGWKLFEGSILAAVADDYHKPAVYPQGRLLFSLMVFLGVWKRTEVSLLFVQRGFNQAGNAIILVLRKELMFFCFVCVLQPFSFCSFWFRWLACSSFTQTAKSANSIQQTWYPTAPTPTSRTSTWVVFPPFSLRQPQ